MIPRVCILCDEVWTPKPSDGDYQDACPKCRRRHATDEGVRIDASPTANTTNDGYEATVNTYLTVEGDAALDELARHEATVAVPVATLREWLDAIERVVSLEEYDRLIFLEPEFMVREDCDEIKKTLKEMHTLLSTNAENGPGVESE